MSKVNHTKPVKRNLDVVKDKATNAKSVNELRSVVVELVDAIKELQK